MGSTGNRKGKDSGSRSYTLSKTGSNESNNSSLEKTTKNKSGNQSCRHPYRLSCLHLFSGWVTYQPNVTATEDETTKGYEFYAFKFILGSCVKTTEIEPIVHDCLTKHNFRFIAPQVIWISDSKCYTWLNVNFLSGNRGS